MGHPPRVICSVCGRTKDPMKHMRADHPPTAAKVWLKRTCANAGEKPCEFTYLAGIDLSGLVQSIKERSRCK